MRAKFFMLIILTVFCIGKLLSQCDQGGSFDVSWDPINPTCAAPDNGSITITSAVGTGATVPPFTYVWSNGDDGDAVSGLSAGAYDYSAG